jgi:hypothetical protein
MFVCDKAALEVEVVYAGRKGHALWLLLLLLKLLQRLELLPLAPRHHSLDLRCRRRRLLSSHLLFEPNGEEPNELSARTHSRARADEEDEEDDEEDEEEEEDVAA